MAEETALERARRLASEERAKGEKPADISKVFQNDADNYAKYTTRLPKDLISGLKQRALMERTTPAKLLTEVVEELLARPARDPDAAAKAERQRRRVIT